MWQFIMDFITKKRKDFKPLQVKYKTKMLIITYLPRALK